MTVPELVAHRGYAHRFPENTLAAVDAAIRAGARHVEIDVQISADGFPVLFHDRTLERMCGVSGAVHELTLAELRALSCHEPKKFGEQFRGEGIASLASFAQLVRRHPHVHAFVEIKRVAIERLGNERVLEKVLAAIEPAIAQCSLISFSIPFLTKARRVNTIRLGAVFDKWKEREHAAVWELAPEFVFCDVDGLPARGALQHDHAKIAVYEITDAAQARSLHARGVDLVETFEIAELLAALGDGKQGAG